MLILPASAGLLGAAGIERVAVSDHAITVFPSPESTVTAKVVAIEPYDTYQSSRGWGLGKTSNGANLALDRDEAAVLTFTATPGPFDPQMENSTDPVDADSVQHLTIRAKVLNHTATIPATVFVFGNGGYSSGNLELVADGEWHLARFDLSSISGQAEWEGLKTLRIDFPNDTNITGYENTEILIDWIAVTRTANFENPLTVGRADKFWDLGYQPPVGTVNGATSLSIPRLSGLKDLYYQKFLMVEGFTPVGSYQWVSDFSGLSYKTTTNHGFKPAGNGADSGNIEAGIYKMGFTSSPGLFDPQLVNSNSEIDGNQCSHIHVRARFTGYTGNQQTVKATAFSTGSGLSFASTTIDPTGDWQILHFPMNSHPAWGGQENLRLDLPDDLANVNGFAEATLEVDWMAATKTPDYDGIRPLDGYEIKYDFEIDRLQTPIIQAKGRQGIDAFVPGDFAILEPDVGKLNFTINQLLDSSPNPRVHWEVDGIPFGLNPGPFDSIHHQVTELGKQGINTYMVLLNAANPTQVNDTSWPLINRRSSAQSPNSLYAFNVGDAYGMRYTRALFDYVAHRMAQPGVTPFDHWIYGNEVDAHWFWHNLGEISPTEFKDYFAIEFRQAALVLAQYHPKFRLLLSHTHHWTDQASPGNPNRSLPSKVLIDDLNATWTEQGNFYWEVASHPYPENLFDPVFWEDVGATLDFNTVKVTYKNLEVLSEYFEQPKLRFNNRKRPISLTEQGFHTPTITGPGTNLDGLDGQRLQAAAYAYHWHRFKRIPGIKADITHRFSDTSLEGGLLLGLLRDEANIAKLAYDVFNAADRPDWRPTFDLYLPQLPFASFDDSLSLPAWTTLRLTFEEPGFNEGIRNLNNVTGITQTTGGSLAGIVAGSDPQIGNPNFFAYQHGSDRLFIRMKTDTGSRLDIFWGTQANNSFAPDRSFTTVTLPDSRFHTYEINTLSHPQWDETLIRRLRIDPTEAANGTFEIDYISTGRSDDFTTDSDGDGVPDADERLWNRNPYVSENRAANADGDAYTDLEEMVMGTDPDDNSEFLQFQRIDGTEVSASFNARPNRTYTLLKSADLGDAEVWEEIDSISSLVPGMASLRDTTGLEPRMFYRIRVQMNLPDSYLTPLAIYTDNLISHD
ncbi:MAG: DUF5722 domain-containing protein [Akkermansiaceae bacterium]